MTRFRPLGLGLAIALVWGGAWPTAGQAGLVWTSDWGVILGNNSALPGSASSAFGATATMNGEVKDVKADTAVAKGFASAISDPNVVAFGLGEVDFARNFQLQGPPNAWRVTLSGLLAGVLDASSSAQNIRSVTRVLAHATVETALGNVVLDIGGANSTWFERFRANNNQINMPVLAPLSDTALLPNGNYTVFGEFSVGAEADKGPLAIASASSSFFNSLSVSVTAQAVPEPSTFLLSGLALLGLATVRLMRWAAA